MPRIPRPRCGGFTLLEVVLFIIIVLLITGFLVPAILSTLGSQDLQNVSEEVEIYARAARSKAVQEGRPAQVVFSENGVGLWLGGGGVEDEYGEPTPDRFLPWPTGVKASLRPWPWPDWITPENWVWSFQPSGLVQPLRLRLEQGEAWIELEFSPTTAEIRDESYYLP